MISNRTSFKIFLSSSHFHFVSPDDYEDEEMNEEDEDDEGGNLMIDEVRGGRKKQGARSIYFSQKTQKNSTPVNQDGKIDLNHRILVDAVHVFGYIMGNVL